MRMSLLGGLATISAQTLVLALAILAVRAWRRRRGHTDPASLVAAAVLGAAASLLLLSTVVDAARPLHHAHQSAVAPRRGLTYCFEETNAAGRLPFINWLRRRLPEDAVYELAFAPQPDVWCLTLALLPRVPAYGNDSPRWLVVYGTTPPAVKAMIARHDPVVQEFSPGFALVRLRP